ncbi:hypothetical protein AFLA_003828 [Aspergillus flavus NRRL3357]|nr:hypothetical protein AFLA_003828 [Aspergillus flavus NRRL3357]
MPRDIIIRGLVNDVATFYFITYLAEHLHTFSTYIHTYNASPTWVMAPLGRMIGRDWMEPLRFFLVSLLTLKSVKG